MLTHYGILRVPSRLISVTLDGPLQLLPPLTMVTVRSTGVSGAQAAGAARAAREPGKGAGSPGLGHVVAYVRPRLGRAFSQGRRRALGMIRTAIITTLN